VVERSDTTGLEFAISTAPEGSQKDESCDPSGVEEWEFAATGGIAALNHRL